MQILKSNWPLISVTEIEINIKIEITLLPFLVCGPAADSYLLARFHSIKSLYAAIYSKVMACLRNNRRKHEKRIADECVIGRPISDFLLSVH